MEKNEIFKSFRLPRTSLEGGGGGGGAYKKKGAVRENRSSPARMCMFTFIKQRIKRMQ